MHSLYDEAFEFGDDVHLIGAQLHHDAASAFSVASGIAETVTSAPQCSELYNPNE